MKKILFFAVCAVMSAYGFELPAPTATRRLDKGWKYIFNLPAAVAVNHAKIELVGEVKSWHLACEMLTAARGKTEQIDCNLSRVFQGQRFTLEVEADREPQIGAFSVTKVPYANAVDQRRLRVVQQKDNQVFIDFGAEVALRSLTFDGVIRELTDLDVYGSWEVFLEDGADWLVAEGNQKFGKLKDFAGRTTFTFHDVCRARYFLLRAKNHKLKADSVQFDVVPYDYTQSITGETWEQKLKRLEWWTEARFGMFIHFGLYAMPAANEWIKTLKPLSEEKYQEYFENFNPDRFDAKEWAKAAKAAGMKYVVLTSKHHEGFCLWDSKVTDYKITNTPFKRDLLKEYVEAFRAEGLKVGFYYSLIDWHHPDFIVDFVHPRRAGNMWCPNTGAEGYAEINRNRDMARYRQYMKSQVQELLTNYGRIDIIWFDFSYAKRNGKSRDDWDSIGLIKLAKQLQPHIIIDNRLDLTDYSDGWDFLTPEQSREAFWPTFRGLQMPWETCQTFSGSWGYYRDEKNWKSSFQCIEQLIETVSKGGNVIMNVGPTARGEFDYRAKDRLAAYGRWLDACGESIYGCTAAPAEYSAPNGTILTYNPKTRKLYMHMLCWNWGSMTIPFMDSVKYVQLLNDKSELTHLGSQLNLPTDKPPVEIPVIEFTLR